jgi:hypothetical protein
MSSATNLAAIKQTYFLIDDNFDQIYSQCSTPDQKQQATELRDGARDAYWKAVASTLADDSNLVNTIRAELQDTNSQVKSLLTNLQDIVSFLKLLTEALKLACSLTVLAAAV